VIIKNHNFVVTFLAEAGDATWTASQCKKKKIAPGNENCMTKLALAKLRDQLNLWSKIEGQSRPIRQNFYSPFHSCLHKRDGTTAGTH